MQQDVDTAARVATLFEQDRFARESGVEILEVGAGFARTAMNVEERHLNAVGILQGGAVFTLADLAFGLASNSHGMMAVGCQVDITYLKAVRAGRLTAVAEEISRTRSISTCLIRVLDEREELVAIFKGVAFIKGKPLDLPA